MKTNIGILLALTFGLFSCKKETSSVNPQQMANSAVWQLVKSPDGTELFEVIDIQEDKYGRIWIGSHGSYDSLTPTGNISFRMTKISRVNPNGYIAETIDTTHSKLLKGRLFSFAFHPNGNLSLGLSYPYHLPGTFNTFHEAVVQEDNGVFTKTHYSNSIFYEFTSFTTNLNGLWFGKTSDGLIHFDGTNFTHHYPPGPTSSGSNSVYNILNLSQDKLIYSTGQALYSYDQGISTPIMDNVRVKSMDLDSDGNLWIIGYFNGLNSNYKVFKIDIVSGNYLVSPFDFPGGIHPTNLVVDSHNNIWIGTTISGNNGLYKYNGSNWINYNVSNSPLHDNALKKLKVDENGNLFIGGFYHGLMILNEFGTRN